MPSRELDFQKRTIHNSRNSSHLTSPADSISEAPSGDLPIPDRASRGTFARGIPVADLPRFAEEWHLACAYRLHSENTTETRRYFVKNLLWFLNQRGYTHCGTSEMRQFFDYLLHGHEDEGGRWGNPRLNKGVRPVTVKDYWVNLRCLFNWLVDEGLIEQSPLSRIPKPRVPVEKVEPFTREQIQALLQAARRSKSVARARRDEAIVLFLLDTGVRASELCGITLRDLDLPAQTAYVLGKGNRHRTVYYSKVTGKALSAYLRLRPREEDSPVFQGEWGANTGESLSRSGLLQLIQRLAKESGIKAAKASPHVFRHTACVELLRSGCDVFHLMNIMGHQSLKTSESYIKLSALDTAQAHARHSPVERMTASRASKRRP